MDLFLTDTFQRIVSWLSSIGSLEAVAAGFAGVAFGIGYRVMHVRMADGEELDLARVGWLGARVVLGVIFFVMGGINGFLQLAAEHPSSMHATSAAAARFQEGLLSTGYMFPLLKSVELVAGALLLVSRWVPLALVLLAPVVLNIFLYHAALDPRGLPLAILIVALELALAWRYRASFASLFVARPVFPAGRPAPRGFQTGSLRPASR